MKKKTKYNAKTQPWKKTAHPRNRDTLQKGYTGTNSSKYKDIGNTKTQARTRKKQGQWTRQKKLKTERQEQRQKKRQRKRQRTRQRQRKEEKRQRRG